jgi:hypothetical protein
MFPFIFPLAVVGSLVYNLFATNHEIEVIKETEDNEQRMSDDNLSQSTSKRF